MARLEEDRDAARQRAEAAEEWGRGMAESRLNYMTMWGNVRVERDAALMQVSSTARALGEMEAERDALQARVAEQDALLRDLAQDRHCHDGKCDHYNHGHYLCTCRLVEYMVPQEATP